MIKLFRSNKVLLSVLFIPILLLLTGLDYLQQNEIPALDPSNPIVQFILGPVRMLEPLYQYLITVLIVLLQSWLIIYFSNKHQLQKSSNLLAGFFYILFLACRPETFVLDAAILANTFIIIAIDQVLALYKKIKSHVGIFNAGFCIAMAALFEPTYIVLSIWVYVAISQLRSFKIKERLLLVISFLIPFYLIGSAYYYFSDIKIFFTDSLWAKFKIWDGILPESVALITVLISMSSSLILMMNYRKVIIKRQMVVQRKILSILLLFMVCFLTLIINGQQAAVLCSLLALPIALYASILASISKIKWAELITVLLIANIICLRINLVLELFAIR